MLQKSSIFPVLQLPRGVVGTGREVGRNCLAMQSTVQVHNHVPVQYLRQLHIAVNQNFLTTYIAFPAHWNSSSGKCQQLCEVWIGPLSHSTSVEWVGNSFCDPLRNLVLNLQVVILVYEPPVVRIHWSIKHPLHDEHWARSNFFFFFFWPLVSWSLHTVSCILGVW